MFTAIAVAIAFGLTMGMHTEALPQAPIEMTDAEAHARIMERKEKAAKAASNVGEMQHRFKEDLDDLMHNPQSEIQQSDPLAELYKTAYGEGASAGEELAPEALQRQRERHENELEKAADGKEGIALIDEDPTLLGRNQVGSGDSPMELNGAMFASLDGSGQGVKQIDHTKAHESAHGRQVDAPIEWLEGHAEISANEETGMGLDERRAGQPTELYGEGQTIVAEAVHLLDRQTVEDGMTRDFNIIIRKLMASEDPRAQELLQTIAESN